MDTLLPYENHVIWAGRWMPDGVAQFFPVPVLEIYGKKLRKTPNCDDFKCVLDTFGTILRKVISH